MLTVYVIRHGEAEGNAERRIMGHSNHSLTANGEKDAETLGEKLRSVKFDKVYSSDLKRACDTANIISKMLDLPFAPESTEKLREIDPGECCGMDLDAFLEKYPASRNNIDYRYPGGEGYKEFYGRIAEFLKSLEKDHDGETVLIVAHGGVAKAVEYYSDCFESNDLGRTKISHEYIGRFVIDCGKSVKKS